MRFCKAIIILELCVEKQGGYKKVVKVSNKPSWNYLRRRSKAIRGDTRAKPFYDDAGTWRHRFPAAWAELWHQFSALKWKFYEKVLIRNLLVF